MAAPFRALSRHLLHGDLQIRHVLLAEMKTTDEK